MKTLCQEESIKASYHMIYDILYYTIIDYSYYTILHYTITYFNML